MYDVSLVIVIIKQCRPFMVFKPSHLLRDNQPRHGAGCHSSTPYSYKFNEVALKNSLSVPRCCPFINKY